MSGGSDGLIAVSSPTTGLTVRVITDHRGAPITNFDVTASQVSNAVDKKSCVQQIYKGYYFVSLILRRVYILAFTILGWL